MKIRLLSLSTLLLSMFFVGCVSVDERMQGYMGQHYSKVVAIWGAPQTELDDGEGGQLLTWVFTETHTNPATVRTTTTQSSNSNSHTHANSHTHGNGHSHAHHAATQQALHGQNHHSTTNYHGNTNINSHGNQVSTTTFTPETTTTNTYTRSFYVDADGYIYNFAWKGWHPGY
jgi:hypothetical protein